MIGPRRDASTRLLVTGASGFLGSTLCERASRDFAVYGAYHSRKHEIPGCTTARLDLRDYRAVKDALGDIRPDIVVNTAAVGDPNFCQENPDRSRAVNLDAAATIAGLCSDLGAKLIHTSTDLIFDGEHAPYSEDSPPAPVSRYGEHKALAEEAILERYPSAAIIRLPLMFGPDRPDARKFFSVFLETMRAGKPLNLFTDEGRTPTSSLTASDYLLAFGAKITGRLHLGGPETISRYRLGELMAEIFGIPHPRLVARLQTENIMAATRPRDVSLDSGKARAMGYAPMGVRDELVRLRGIME